MRDHAGDGVEGLFSVVGAKYTTARAVAERVVDRVLSKLPGRAGPCRTASMPLPGGHVRDVMLTIADARREYDALRAERHDSAPGRRLRIALSRRDGAVAHPARVVRRGWPATRR